MRLSSGAFSSIAPLALAFPMSDEPPRAEDHEYSLYYRSM